MLSQRMWSSVYMVMTECVIVMCGAISSVSTEFIVEFEESQWEPGRWRELQKVPGNQATALLALNGHLNYQFRVYAVNAVGPGPPSEPTERYKTPPAGRTHSF